MTKVTKESVYGEIRKAGSKGKALRAKSKMPYIGELLGERKIKKEGSKYYLWEIEIPLGQKRVVERLLKNGLLRKSGKKYIIVKTPELTGIPSFLEFVETIQKIYLRKARRYREEIRILPLIEELVSEMDITEILAKKWILDLPRIFIGIVDLRPFSDERGLKLENGTEVSRIYLERGIVGL
jgi:hypothetical protein